MSEKMKILYVTPHWPTAAAYGAQQRVLNVARLLGRFGEVSFAIVPFARENEQVAPSAERGSDVLDVFHESPIPGTNRLDRLRHRLRYELDPSYLATHHCTVSANDRIRLLELIKDHDLIWVHTLRVANLFGIRKWPHSVLDVDDLSSRFYWSQAQSGTSLPRRLLDLRLSWMWRQRERLLTERFDVVAVCSEEDHKYLGSGAQIHVIPNGYNPPANCPRVASEPPRIGFIGNFEYRPNEEGVRWFVAEVWPLIKRKVPSVQLRLVGRAGDTRLAHLTPDVAALGWVEDPTDEIASWSAMIVPVKVGGGTRIKIAEGFARKCPVVSTALGAFGYDVRNGDEILLADTADDYASACVRLLTTPEMGDTLAKNAHRRFLRQWTWDSSQNAVCTVVEEVLARSSRLENKRELVDEVAYPFS